MRYSLRADLFLAHRNESYYDNLSLHLLFVTTFALNLHADVRRPALFSGHPLAHCPRRIVPHVLSMTTIQLR